MSAPGGVWGRFATVVARAVERGHRRHMGDGGQPTYLWHRKGNGAKPGGFLVAPDADRSAGWELTTSERAPFWRGRPHVQAWAMTMARSAPVLATDEDGADVDPDYPEGLAPFPEGYSSPDDPEPAPQAEEPSRIEDPGAVTRDPRLFDLPLFGDA